MLQPVEWGEEWWGKVPLIRSDWFPHPNRTTTTGNKWKYARKTDTAAAKPTPKKDSLTDWLMNPIHQSAVSVSFWQRMLSRHSRSILIHDFGSDSVGFGSFSWTGFSVQLRQQSGDVLGFSGSAWSSREQIITGLHHYDADWIKNQSCSVFFPLCSALFGSVLLPEPPEWLSSFCCSMIMIGTEMLLSRSCHLMSNWLLFLSLITHTHTTLLTAWRCANETKRVWVRTHGACFHPRVLTLRKSVPIRRLTIDWIGKFTIGRDNPLAGESVADACVWTFFPSAPLLVMSWHGALK